MIIVLHVRRTGRSPYGNRRFSCRFLGDDIDDAGQRIGTILGRSGTADDFNAFNRIDVDPVQGQQILCRSRIFNSCTLTIDEDQSLIAGHAAHGNAVAEPGARVHDLYIICQSQSRVDIGSTQLLDVFCRNDFYRIWNRLYFGFCTGSRNDDVFAEQVLRICLCRTSSCRIGRHGHRSQNNACHI